MNLTPLGDRVVVKALDEEDVTAAGIVLPETAKERPHRGRVLAVGQGRYEDGKRIPLDVREGDEIVFSKYGATEVKLDGEEVLILAERDILAKVVGGSSARRLGATKPSAAKAASTKASSAKAASAKAPAKRAGRKGPRGMN
jgi:chaperonin GroES